MAGFWKAVLGFLAGEGFAGAIEKIKHKFEETIEELEHRIERATIKVIKTSILFLMISLGAIFMLVGLAQYLNETVPNLAHGLGTVVVGAILIVLAMLVRLLK